MKALPNPGTYPAKTNGQMVIYETDNGALCVAIPVALMGSEIAWHGKFTATLGKSDNTLMKRSIDNLKKVFGWDGLDPFVLAELDTSTTEFEIVGEHESYTPPGDNQEEKIIFKIQWLNPPGGGMVMPEPADRKAVLTKWESKFKAIAGSKPVAKSSKKEAAPKKPAQVGPPSRRSNATSVTARSATQEEIWDALVKANEGVDETELGTHYYAAQDELFPGRNGELTPKEWGDVMTKLGL